MRGRKLPRLRDGDVFEPWHYNELARALEALLKLQGAGGIVVNLKDTGGVISFSGGGGILYARNTASIAARTVATVTLYTSIRDATTGSTTEAANVSPDTIPAGRLLYLDAATGDILFWSCGAAPTTAMS